MRKLSEVQGMSAAIEKYMNETPEQERSFADFNARGYNTLGLTNKNFLDTMWRLKKKGSRIPASANIKPMKPIKQQASDRQKELEDIIQKAQDAYYQTGDVIMSDADFDALWDELKQDYPNSKILQKVGSDTSGGDQTVKHIIVMGSQFKANTPSEMDDFFKKTRAPYIAQRKLDGCSISLNYRDGKLVQAVTRGDGVYGTDITENAMKMRGVPHQLKSSFTGAVRGEVLLYRADLKQHFPSMKNARNAAAGIMKRLDGADSDKLTIMCYDAQYLDGSSFGTQMSVMSWLEDEGFLVAPYDYFPNPTGTEAVEYINQLFSKSGDFEYDCDGVVWKQNAIDMTDIKNNLRPKTQIALKIKQMANTTILRDIEWSVKNGTLTPVAIVDPTYIEGSTVKRASLANVAQMEALDLEIGDSVSLIKAGYIIPKIIANISKNKRVEKENYFD